MAAVVKQQSSALLAEQRSIRELPEANSDSDTDFDPSHYLGASGRMIDQLLARARDAQETS